MFILAEVVPFQYTVYINIVGAVRYIERERYGVPSIVTEPGRDEPCDLSLCSAATVCEF